MVLDGVLRGQHHKRIRQRVGVVVDGNLRFVHRFEQGRLRFRRGAVDFVGHNDVREHRPGLELEILSHVVEHADADHVAGKQIGSELNSLERAVEGARNGMRQGGFAHARHVFQQEMPAREQRHQRHLNHFFLALDDLRDGAL